MIPVNNYSNMNSASRIIFKTLSSPQASNLPSKSAMKIFAYSTSCANHGEIQITKNHHDPKKIRNVRGCVPVQEKSENRMIHNFAKLSQQKLSEEEKCAVNFV